MVGPPWTVEDRIEHGLKDLIGKVVRIYVLTNTVCIGRLHELVDGVVALTSSSGRTVGALPVSEIRSIQEMPDPSDKAIADLIYDSRLHAGLATEALKDGDLEHWCIQACVRDLAELTDLMEVIDSPYRDI